METPDVEMPENAKGDDGNVEMPENLKGDDENMLGTEIPDKVKKRVNNLAEKSELTNDVPLSLKRKL